MAKTNEEIIIKKLDQILRVLAFQLAIDKSITDGARALKIAGLDNQTIAELLNTTPATVRSVTSGISRSAK